MTDVARPHAKRLDLGLLLVILLIAGFLRVQNLGALGFWIDEDLTWLASDSILKHGYPLMPSGEVYTRALLYSYLIAGTRWLFGDAEAVLRAPSVIFTLLTVIVAYGFGRTIGGRWTGLVAALVLAVSPWEWHYAQMARMYGLFSLFFLLSIWCIYHGLFRGSRRALWGSIALVVPTVLSHLLGTALALLFVLPWLFRGRPRPPVAWSILGVLVAGLTLNARGWVFPSAGLEAVDRPYAGGTYSLPMLPLLNLNHSELLAQRLSSANPLLTAGLLAILIAGCLLFMRVVWRAGARGIPLLGFGLLCVALLANQLVVAGLIAVAVIKLQARDTNEALAWLRRCGVWMGVAFAVWMAGSIVVEGAHLLSARRFVRLFVSLPTPYYRLLFEQYPLMFATATAGFGWIYFQSFRANDDQSRLFVALAFFGPLLLMGFFYAPFTGYRYNIYLNPVFVILYAYILVSAVRAIVGRAGVLGRRPTLASIVLGALALVVGCEQFDPPQTWAAIHRGYGYNRESIDDPDLNASFRYDYKGCAEHVAAAFQPGDLVFSINATEVLPYGVKADYRIMKLTGLHAKRGETLVDWYTGAPLIVDAPTLQASIEAHDTGACWVIYTEERQAGPSIHLPEDMQAYLSGLQAYRVYNGRDGQSYVLRIP